MGGPLPWVLGERQFCFRGRKPTQEVGRGFQGPGRLKSRHRRRPLRERRCSSHLTSPTACRYLDRVIVRRDSAGGGVAEGGAGGIRRILFWWGPSRPCSARQGHPRAASTPYPVDPTLRGKPTIHGLGADWVRRGATGRDEEPARGGGRALVYLLDEGRDPGGGGDLKLPIC